MRTLLLKSSKIYSTKLLLLTFLLGVNTSVFSQGIIANQGFQGSDTSNQINAFGDNWEYTFTNTNGPITVVNTPSYTTPNSLEILNWWDNNVSINFNQIDISNYTDVTLSIAFQTDGTPEAPEDLFLDYTYYNSNTSSWVSVTVNLVDATNDFTDAVNFGVNGTVSNPYTFIVPNTANATLFSATVRVLFSEASGGNDTYYIDDVSLSGNMPAAPTASCQDISIELDAFGNASILPTEIDNGSTVSVGSPSLSLDVLEFTCLNLGANTVNFTVEDGIGQTSSCSAIVTVSQTTAPLTTPVFVDVNAYCSYTVIAPSDLSYKCSNIVPTTTDPLTYNTPGSYTVNWTYDGGVEGIVNATQNIILNPLPVPSNVLATTINADTAIIEWDEFLGVDTFNIRFRKIGSPNWITLTSNTNAVSLSGLQQLTNYEIQVSSICDSVNSTYSTLYSFLTLKQTYCIPDVPTTSSNHYIDRVRVGTIDNTSGFDNGYGDYSSFSTDLYKGNSYTLELDVLNNNDPMGYTVWIDFNSDGDFNDSGELVWLIGNDGDADPTNNTTNATYITTSITIPANTNTVNTIMRIGTRRYWYADDPCSGSTWGNPGEYEDYSLNIIIDPSSDQEIEVSGNNNEIANNSITISSDNNTGFGVYDIYEMPLTKTYTITNNGGLDLNLTGAPIVDFVSPSTDFTITQPTQTTLVSGESTTFEISFDPSTIGIKQATVSILNNDADESAYNFLIEGEGALTFPDTDGDGVQDNADGDDDNDGILDVDEDNICNSYINSYVTNTIFINETFGAGLTRVNIDANISGASSSYCYEDGTGALCGDGTTDLNDGEYVVYNNATTDIASWSNDYWYQGGDHTGDTNGRMAIFNANEEPGIFYSAIISGVTPNILINYGFSVINLDRSDAPGIATRERPEVLIEILDPNGNLIHSVTSGLIQPTNPSNPNGDWLDIATTFTTSYSMFVVQLSNAQPGGQGNDLAIDDIFVKQVLCDFDGDGVADSVDLDNDNDGIPNIVELGLIDGDKDATLFGDGWLDTNGNGVHDSYEGGVTLLDIDNDGMPNYMDLDSDNDGIFDSEEYDGLGDVDVDGDGLGDGSDINSTVFSDEADGDGILAIIDGNDSDADGSDHGSAGYATPLDLDGDGIPNYLDVDSNDASNNPLNGTDISETLYAVLDADNDGVIDGNIDVDNDGILDVLDTDNVNFGSPRDLEDSYSLFFDGRNDYVEDSNVISSGTTTLMAWIKSEGDNTLNTNRIVAGQSNIYLVVNDSDNTVTVMLNGSAVLTSTDVIVDNIWSHVAVSTRASQTVLYINGEAQGSPLGSGGVTADASSFTIGRLANTNLNYFHGEIDEVRVFDSSLTAEEIQRTVYQELDENLGFNQGKIIPKAISANAIGSNLVRYYKMDGFKGDITDNKVTPTIDQITGAKLYNIKQIYIQTAPLPYRTIQDGLWTTTANWEYGNVWDIVTVSDNKDWSIVEINNNISTTASHTNLGLVVQDAQTLTVNSSNYINNSWYLELNGTLDLLEESQLIQTNQSDLVTDTDGKILRRQEGVANVYRYNYWGSPVGQTQTVVLSDNNLAVNNTNNTAFNLSMLNDNALAPIEFTTSYDEVGKISAYWTYIYQNGVTYYDWENIDPSYSIPTGVGYIHKGTGVGVSDFQYVFEGKPNNGTIVIAATDTGGAGSVGGVSMTEYLLGNPYPSALDGHQFITDNASVINGEIYLWEQWGGNSHNLGSYEGGYATLNLMTSVKAYQFVGLDGANNGSQDGTKIPTQFLPVAQGFMVEVENSGDIKFNNSQRVYKTEASGDSVFFRTSNQITETNNSSDPIQMIRLEFKDANNLGRELVLGFSNITTDGFDYGYDAKAYEINNSDLYLPLLDNKMIIQGYSSVTEDKEVDLTFIAATNSQYQIKATDFVAFLPEQEVYLRDTLTGVYHDLTSNQSYSFTSVAGTFANRFDIVFQNLETLSNEELELQTASALIYFNNNKLFAKGIKQVVKAVTFYNTLGQQVYNNTSVSNSHLANGIQISSLSTGMYVVSIKTENNQSFDKKIIIK